ncbi:hypothetical protein U9M48_037233 [Paspalum notatum var. saurae]|uniref:Uncharacterized protein n=1 Tax=Paspalum notatum var. saurae TaxID=547442 RepID=A0AAQ3UKR5_PASNO
MSDVVDAGTKDVVSLCRANIQNRCLPHFRSLLAELNSCLGVPPVTSGQRRRMELHPGSRQGHQRALCAALDGQCVCGYLGYRTLMEKGIFPGHLPTLRLLHLCLHLKNGFLDTPASDWAPRMSKHIKLKDLPRTMHSTDPDNFMFHLALKVPEQHIAGADAIILNTFDEPE